MFVNHINTRPRMRALVLSQVTSDATLTIVYNAPRPNQTWRNLNPELKQMVSLLIVSFRVVIQVRLT